MWGLAVGSPLYLSLQMCGLLHRLLSECPPQESSAAALLLLGFCLQQVVVQTVSARREVEMLYNTSCICLSDVQYVLKLGVTVSVDTSYINLSETQTKGKNENASTMKLTVSLHGVSLSFFTFFPIVQPGDKLHFESKQRLFITFNSYSTQISSTTCSHHY